MSSLSLSLYTTIMSTVPGVRAPSKEEQKINAIQKIFSLNISNEKELKRIATLLEETKDVKLPRDEIDRYKHLTEDLEKTALKLVEEAIDKNNPKLIANTLIKARLVRNALGLTSGEGRQLIENKIRGIIEESTNSAIKLQVEIADNPTAPNTDLLQLETTQHLIRIKNAKECLVDIMPKTREKR